MEGICKLMEIISVRKKTKILNKYGFGDKMTGRIFIFKNVSGVWKKDYITNGSYEYVDVPTGIGLTGASITEGVNSSKSWGGFGSAIAMNDDYLIAGYLIHLVTTMEPTIIVNCMVEFLYLREIQTINMYIIQILVKIIIIQAMGVVQWLLWDEFIYM